MAACPSCGTASPAGAKFCAECGTPLASSAPVREERRMVTVLFADLAGFTSRAETMDPEDVRAFLHPWYELLEREVTGHGGVVERHLGDGVMALFGAPVAHEDDPERAVRSALRILERLPSLDLELHARIGVNTGEVLFAAATGPGREDAVTGDAVNTAARLQAAAPVDSVLIGEPTYRATSRLFTWEAVAPVAAKGKADPVPAWRPIGPVARVAGEPLPETTPFVGRDFELQTLVRLFERSRSTPGLEVVTVVADPGIGKSRLVRELGRYVDALPELVTWRVGRCLPYGEGIGFWALSEIVKAQAGILDTDDQVTLGAKLDAVLDGVDPSLRAWVKDRVAPLVGLETTTQPPQTEEAYTAWRRFLESVAAAGPTVLVVEDLHWADQGFVAFLQHVAANTAGLPILLLATARPEVEERHPAWLARARHATVISLDALVDRDMATLLGAAVPDASPELVATILERAAGSPLYAEQLAAMARDRPAGAPLDVAAIPPTIAALLASRIDALPADAKAILLDASVVGKTFWSGAVAALGGRERAEVETFLAELGRRDLVRPVHPSSMADEQEYAFVHALVRDVAYGELTRSARLARHKAVAAWITDRTGAALGEDAEIVVAHLERALELAEAAGATTELRVLRNGLGEALIAAADHAVRSDVPTGVARLRSALAMLGDGDPRLPEAWARLGPALADLEEYEQAIEAFERARSGYLAGGREVEAAVLAYPLYRAYLQRGNTALADRVFSDAGPVLRAHGGRELAEYLAAAAHIAWTRDEHLTVIRLVDEALAIADALGLPPPYRALVARGNQRLDQGDRVAGEADLHEALRLTEAAGDTLVTLNALDNLGSVLQEYSLEDAASAFETEIAFARSRGLPTTVGESSLNDINVGIGRWDEGLGALWRLEAQSRDRGDAYIHLYTLGQIARIEIERGTCRFRPDELADEARRFGRPYALQALLPAAVRLATLAGNRDLARTLLKELVDASPQESLRLADAATAVRAAVGAGCIDLAERLRDLGSPIARRAGVVDAAVAEASGNHAVARDWYVSAVGWTQSVGDLPERAFALAGLGRCLVALGETHEGTARLREARELWVGMKATPRIAEIDEVLAGIGEGT